jgi:hypothetical protein
MNHDFLKFAQFSKVEEQSDGAVVVWGIATMQEPDLDNEVCDYDTAKPVYQAWSDASAKRTKRAGQDISLGNVRIQHGLEIGGKATKLEFDDAEKSILLGSVPYTEQIHKDLKAGYFTGYSQGGSYAWRRCTDCGKNLSLRQADNFCPDCKTNVTVLYGLKKIAEVSYVDSPCSGQGFSYVKANGSREIIKFAKRSTTDMELSQQQIEQIADAVNKKDKKTKRVAGKDLTAADFAYVGDPEKTDTWKLPIHDASHCRNALARFEQTKGIPAEEKPKVKAKIVAAAKKFGIEVSEEGETKTHQEFVAGIAKRLEDKGVAKGMYQVGFFAEMLQSIANLYESSLHERDREDDDSDVPEALGANLEDMIETFIAMATEEARELAAGDSGKSTKGETNSMTQEEQDALTKAAKKSLSHHFAKTAVHHEKMQAHHETAAASHEQMCDACKAAHAGHKKAEVADVNKADVGDDHPEAHVAAGDYYKAAGIHHAAKASHHEKCAKTHGAMAEHCHKMAESHDAEEHEKTVKAEVEAGDPTPVRKVGSVLDIEAEVAKETERMRSTPEHKQAVAQIAKGRLDREIEEKLQQLRATTVVPDGVKLAGASGEGEVIRIVPRTPPKDAFNFAKSEANASPAGI